MNGNLVIERSPGQGFRVGDEHILLINVFKHFALFQVGEFQYNVAEQDVFPIAYGSIMLAQINKKRVRIRITAPKSIVILRDELEV